MDVAAEQANLLLLIESGNRLQAWFHHFSFGLNADRSKSVGHQFIVIFHAHEAPGNLYGS